MRKLIHAAILLIVAALPLSAQQPTPFDPTAAMIRIKSHGASATAIATYNGKTWLLGCAHMITGIDGKLDNKRYERVLKMDGPPQPAQGTSTAKIIAYDIQLDLTLIEINNGPFNCIPIAKKGHQPSDSCQSLGYDEMKWPVHSKHATVLGTHQDTTYTVERPWHGRSGGALVDLDAKVLIGVVQGYELGPRGRGMYVSLPAIRRFLDQHFPKPQPLPPLILPINPPTIQFAPPQPWLPPPNC